MVRPRSRVAPTAEEIEAFGNMAEQPRRTIEASVPEASIVTSKKRKEPKVSGYNFRMTAAEKRLLTHAAEMEDISEQKVLERLVWPVLNDRYPDLKS